MKYPKGKFLQNLTTAVKYGDNDMIMDLFADQVTDIALKHPEALNAALKNAGVFVTDSIEPKYLVGLVADNWDNKKLLQNLSLMIADMNTPNGQQNADGSYMHAGSMVGDIVQGVGAAIQGVGTITQAAMQPKIEKEKNKGLMYNYLAAKSGEKSAQYGALASVQIAAQNNKTTITYAVIGLALVAVIAIGVKAYKDSLPPVVTV